MKKLHLTLYILTAFTLISCTGAENPDSAPNDVSIPDLEFECFQGQASDCSTAGTAKRFRVGLLDSTIETDCASLIKSAGSNFNTVFFASGETTTFFDGQSLRGFVTSWVDSSGNSIEKLAIGDYITCSYVDTDINAFLDNGEPIGSQTISIGINTARELLVLENFEQL